MNKDKDNCSIDKGIPFDCEENCSKWTLTRKLGESKIKVGRLILLNLAVGPFLLGIILTTLWTQMDYPKVTSFERICQLLQYPNSYLLMSSFLIWVIYHSCELLLLLALSTDDARFCKLHLTTTAPVMQLLTIFYFVLLMWSVLDPLQEDHIAKFVIIVGSVVILIANLYNAYLKALSTYLRYLAKFSFTMTYWPKETV